MRQDEKNKNDINKKHPNKNDEVKDNNKEIHKKESNSKQETPGTIDLNEVNKEEAVETDPRDKKIEELEKVVALQQDKFLRKAAEFENYKRRTENDQLNLIKYAAESLLIKLLPVLDDFERSLLYIDSAKDTQSIKEGIKLVYDKLLKVLEDQGVKKIDAVGKPFDVHYHEAMLQRKEENVKPHTVIEEIEKGYMYKDRVIRHTKVVVSEDLTEDTESAQNDDNQNNSDEKN
jgi:molecular chaperone GrpE